MTPRCGECYIELVCKSEMLSQCALLSRYKGYCKQAAQSKYKITYFYSIQVFFAVVGKFSIFVIYIYLFDSRKLLVLSSNCDVSRDLRVLLS